MLRLRQGGQRRYLRHGARGHLLPRSAQSRGQALRIEVQERELTEEDIRRNDNRESMFALNGWAYDYFADYLRKSSEGQSVGMSYFRQKRGFTEATIQKFGLAIVRPRAMR